MKKPLTWFSAGVLVVSLSGAAYAGEDKDRCEWHGKGPMAHMDANNDGNISHEEFINSAEQHFGKLDKNGDGVISKDEFKMAHEKRKEMKEERRETMKEKRKEKTQKTE